MVSRSACKSLLSFWTSVAASCLQRGSVLLVISAFAEVRSSMARSKLVTLGDKLASRFATALCCLSSCAEIRSSMRLLSAWRSSLSWRLASSSLFRLCCCASSCFAPRACKFRLVWAWACCSEPSWSCALPSLCTSPLCASTMFPKAPVATLGLRKNCRSSSLEPGETSERVAEAASVSAKLWPVPPAAGGSSGAPSMRPRSSGAAAPALWSGPRSS
mmetsp:Transcript_21934/g.65897  ORF Transcript_21934/g.65897 Transcript_21934/m.65897 type:complete len:217 (+) Transcript_21934:1766-2416(+)